MKNIKFRKCEYEDIEFILKLKEAGMKWYIEKIYGWDINVQREKTKIELDEHIDDMRIIIYDDTDVGVTTFYKENDDYIVGLIVINPKFQGLGIGKEIISSYIDVARNENKKILIKTYKENKAKNLYERLGFIPYKEDNTHVYLSIDFSKV